MSKSSRELKREKKRKRENPPALLRLVRSEDEGLPHVAESPGQPDAPVGPVQEPDRPAAVCGEEEKAGVLVSAPDAGPGRFVEVEVTALQEDEQSFELHTDRSTTWCYWYEPSVYELGHGKDFDPDILRAVYRWMFTRTDCCVLLTKTIDQDLESLGWAKHFTRGETSYWMLPYLDWIRKTPQLAYLGHEFHEMLRAEFERHGSKPELHSEDCQDRHIGSCWEMLKHGQYEKAVSLYNGWARFAGYGCIELKAVNPTILDIGNAVLQIKDSSFKVIRIK